MATFFAKKSGGVKKKTMIILKEFTFSFQFQQAASATGRRAMIHPEIREQPLFFIKL